MKNRIAWTDLIFSLNVIARSVASVFNCITVKGCNIFSDKITPLVK